MHYNDIYFQNLVKEYPNLQGLKVENNVLISENNTIPLGNFQIASLFYDYGDLKEDLARLTSKDFFTILYIHVIYYKDSEKLLNNFKIVSNKENEKDLIKYYQDYLYYLLRYKDYLTDGLRDVLNVIEHKVIALEYQSYHTTLELDFSSKFYEIQNIALEDKRVWQEKKQKSNELLRKKDNTNLVAGYVNAFTILLTVLFFGIIASISLLIFLK